MMEYVSIVGLDTFTKTTFSLIADGLTTTNSRRTSMQHQLQLHFHCTWVTRAPITSYTEKSQQDGVKLKYRYGHLKRFVPKTVPISTWLKSNPPHSITYFYELVSLLLDSRGLGLCL